MAIRARRYGATTGASYTGNLSPNLRDSQTFGTWQDSARRALQQGGRIVSNPDQSKFQVVSPAGRDWGTFDRMSGKEMKSTLRPVKGDEELQDITKEFSGNGD